MPSMKLVTNNTKSAVGLRFSSYYVKFKPYGDSGYVMSIKKKYSEAIEEAKALASSGRNLASIVVSGVSVGTEHVLLEWAKDGKKTIHSQRAVH